jgi:signal transduction histidine kinase
LTLLPPERPAIASPQGGFLPRADIIMAITASMLAIFAVLFVVGFVLLNRAQEQSIQQSSVNREARLAAYGLVQASIDAETGQRGYLLTGDTVFLTPYERGKAQAATEFQRLHSIAAVAPELGSDVAQTETATNAAFAAIDHTLLLHDNHTLTQTQLRDELLHSMAAMDNARFQANSLRRHVEHIIDGVRARNAAGRFGIYVLGGLLGGLTILAVALSFWALRLERRGWRAALAALEDANTAAELARAKAAASDLAKTRFLAVASHDMRQPLHALTLYLSALARRVDTDETKDIVAKMDRAANSLVGMFASLLDLARIQADVVTPEIENFPLQEVIDRVAAEHPDAHVTVRPSPSLLTVHTDPVLLERVLRNLLSNAMRHGGGSAVITITPVANRARISISDRGPGIPKADQQRIFDEFTRLDSRAGAEGLGLGLAIVKRIAEMLDLKLEVRSAPGEGATFSVHAPIAAETMQSTGLAEEPRLDGSKILVLDDDALALEAVAGVLRDAGAEVCACESGAAIEAALAKGLHPDLLVMDLRIDGELRGAEIAKNIRAKLTPPPPVVMITGDTGADTLAFLRASGFAWLIKPVDRAALTATAFGQLREPA